MDLDPDVLTWVGDLTGGEVVAVERQGRWRPHYFLDVRRPNGEMVPLLLRLPRDPEFVAESRLLSHFDLAHEAAVLAALQDTPVQTPHYYGFHSDVPAILMGRVEGTNDLSGASDTERTAALRGYFENLAVLHALEVDATQFPDMRVPSTPESLALDNKFRYTELDYDEARPRLRPEPLLEFAIWWLHEHVPHDRDRPRWVQGDTGPGQFMAHDGHVTALIDWELSHIGDPMLDFGVMRMRNTIYPVGDLRAMFDYYAELTGEPLHREALTYYTVMSMTLTPMAVAVSVQQADVRVDSIIPRFGWDVTLRRGLCDALGEAYGVTVEPPTIPAPLPPARTNLYRFLVDQLEQRCAPIADDEYERYVVGGALGVARCLEREHEVGRQLEADDLDDMGAVLGERPADRESGLAAVDELVRADPASRALELIWLFARVERRREFLWEPMMIAQEARPLERLDVAPRLLVRPPFEPAP